VAEAPGPPERAPKAESLADGQLAELPTEPVSEPINLSGKRSKWTTGLWQEISRSIASLVTTEKIPEDFELRVEILRQLRRAADILYVFEHRSWLIRLVSAGAVYENVLSIVQIASEDLLLIEDDALAQARIPALRAGVKAYLGSDDPRFDEYTRFIDRIARSSESNDPADSPQIQRGQD
jgi:hypothetical protein